MAKQIPVKIEGNEMEQLIRTTFIFSLAFLLIICSFGCGKKDKNPVGSDLEVSVYDLELSSTSRKATISWKTNIAAASEIEYDFSSDYGYRVREEGPAKVEHSLEIAELMPETKYFFRIVGGEAAEFSFVTSSEGLAVKIDPCLKQVKVGETFTLDVWVENVTHLSEIGLRFYFDPSVLDGLGILPGDFLGNNILFISNTYDLGKGIMGIGIGIKRDTPGGERKEVNGSGIVARLSFSVKTAGETKITIDREEILSLKKEDGVSFVDGFDHISLGSAQIKGNRSGR